MVCCQRQEEPKGELCCFAGLSVPVLGQSAGRGCLISHRNYTGALPRVGWPCTVWQQGTTEPLDVPKGRMVPAAGRCLQAGTSVPALQAGCAGGGKGRLHLPRVTAAALLHLCVWEPEKEPCPWGSSICPTLLLDMHILSADLSEVLHGSIRTLQELGVSYIYNHACDKYIVL